MITKKQTIFGYELHLLVTLNGVILDVVLAPAYASDLTIGEELLHGHTDLVVIGNKWYMSAPIASELATTNRLHLVTIP